MSYKAIGWAYELPLKGPAKPVLVALADFADEEGSCYPGQDRICRMTGLSPRTVRRALTRLEDLELIRREHRYDRRGYRTSDRYFLAVDVQVLPVTVTAGQSDHRSHSPRLPATVTGTYRKNHQENPQGGETTPPPVDNSTDTPPTPFCVNHPTGTEKPCTACKIAREAYKGWVPAYTPPAGKPVVHIEGLCDAHRQPEATCEMCTYERSHPVDFYLSLS